MSRYSLDCVYEDDFGITNWLIMTYVRHKSDINSNQFFESLGYDAKITRSLQELGVPAKI